MPIFTNLTNLDIQPSISEELFSSEIKLDDEMRSLLCKFFKENKAINANIGCYTSHIKFGNGNNIIFPNQYYTIASACYDYAIQLSKYCSFCKQYVNTEENKSKLLETKGVVPNVKVLLGNIIGTRLEKADQELFVRFFCDENYRPGRSFFNKDSIRNTEDIFDSNLLTKIPVPNASSSFLGSLVRMLVENVGVYTTLNNYIKEKQRKTSNTASVTLLKPLSSPTQIIYYGVPGCGKSYEVNKVINAELDKYGVADKEYHKVRCVFHPEYCNADFVGQIYPYVKPDNGGVEYRFKPGPFAEIVRRAYRNPAEPFFLIIEEINRGNAAAIFGEMFQLLDRIRPEDGPEELSGNIYNTGWSSYGVTNIDVNAYVRQKSTDNPEKIEYDDSIPYGDKIKFINNTAVRLPPNLSIYATMNTNDQNVFTMDNAFQRRFKSKMIRNVLDENSAQYKTEIDDTGVCWGDFREWINEKILLPQTAILKADDKCLGGWFITGEKINGVDKIKKEDFAEKVLKYLWDDVFKRNKSGEIFVKDDKVNSLSDLIDAFETSVGFESFEKIFKMNDVDKAKLQKQANF